MKWIPVEDEIWWMKTMNNCLRVEDKDVLMKLMRVCRV